MPKSASYRNATTHREAHVVRKADGFEVLKSTCNLQMGDEFFDLSEEQDAHEAAEAFVGARPTNIEMLVNIMTYARSGAMMQVFIMSTLMQVAEKTAKADPKTFDSGFMHGEVWTSCAQELNSFFKKAAG